MTSLADRLRQSPTRSSLSDVFSEEPVPLTVFVTDKKFLYNPPLSDIQYEAVRHLEQVYYPGTYEAMAAEIDPYWTPVRFITEAVLQWGKGSGKDHICRIAVSRVIHLLLCLRDPQSYFGMPQQDSIHALNVASSSSQATRAFFEPLRRALTRKGCWFEDKCSDKEQSIVFAKNLEAISGHSTADTQEGLNLIFGLADEISAFRTKEEAAKFARGPREAGNTAEAIMNMMRTSGSTRFPDGNYKIAAISFPRYRGDAIQQLTNDARENNIEKGENSKRFVSGPHATWDVNPRVRSREQFEDEYKKDPDAARAKYECDPPSSKNTYFRSESALSETFCDIRDPIEIRYEWGKNEHGVGVWSPKFHFSPDLRPIEGAVYAMHGDIGITQDRAGVAMCHVKKWITETWDVGFTEDGEKLEQTERRPTVKVDFVTSFSADLAAKPAARQVEISWYRTLLLELERRGFKIRLYTFDGYQSTDGIQQLRARGIDSYRATTDTVDGTIWKTLRDLIQEGRLDAYYRQTLVTELKQLTRTTNGKLDHPPFGSKDEADALACAASGALAIGGAEDASSTTASLLTAPMPEALGALTELPAGLEDAAYFWTGEPS